MARNKNSTALFDVIHSAKKPPKASPSASIPTPKWWGKNRKLPKPVAAAPAETVGKQRSWLTAAKRNGVTPMKPPAVEAVVISAPVQTVAEPVYESPAVEYSGPVSSEPVSSERAISEPLIPARAPVTDEPQPTQTLLPAVIEPRARFIDRFKHRPAAAPEPATSVFEPIPVSVDDSVESSTVDPAPTLRKSRVRDDRESIVALDSVAGDIRFRLSYAGLVAIGFILVLLLAIAFIAGKQISSQTADDAGPPAQGSTTAPTSGLMAAVGSTDTVGNANTVPMHSDVLSLPAHGSKPETVSATTTPPVPSLPIKTTRDIGMIYVVVQSYPEQDLAQKACDFMNRAGVPCSLVQGPARWAFRDWYSVIGLQPFTKHDPALAEYERTIKVIGAKFTTHPLDQFQPQAYTWREDSDLSQQ